MSRKLVIVESPTKARTIRTFLPREYTVEASLGSVRDLPAKAGEIPAAYKKEKWARFGVDIQNDFKPLYVIPDGKAKTVKQLKEAIKQADELIIATDEDREGESIGWHLVQILKPKVPVKRMVFHEITRQAINEAINHTRDIDLKLVRAQETRRIVDRLYGYTLSPLLWKKVAPGLSAGRVQSVAVRLLVMRERDRRAFHNASYWDLSALLAQQIPDAQEFAATLLSVGGKRVAEGRDFDPATGHIAQGNDVLVLDETAAIALRDELLSQQWKVQGVEEKQQMRNPAPPFITSTLQQEANRKLGLSAQQTMRTAQGLYERGLITYMRTDSTNLSDEAVNAIRATVESKYGHEYLSAGVRQFTKKVKGAQEAHEAIRPAGTGMPTASELGLGGPDAALYDMIWKRTIATQMAEARLQLVTATISAGRTVFRANGKRIQFPGFFRAYVEGTDDPDAALEDREAALPDLKPGQTLDCRKLEPLPHQTKPPARYTEATLVQALEREGVGRPSTYATIIDTVQRRGYVNKSGQQLVPTFTAMAVTGLLEQYFPKMVDLGFTAQMEQSLDDIAEGAAEWLPYLRAFYTGEDGLESQVQARDAQIDPREVGRLPYDGLGMDVRVGRYGAYVEKPGEDGVPLRATLPDNLAPADLTLEQVEGLLLQKQNGGDAFGHYPPTGQPIFVRVGPYGAYVQRGDENNEDKKDIVRTSLPKGVTPENLTLPQAIKLLELPRTIGDHPETGKPVKAAIGRFGPYVMHDGAFASLKTTDDVLTISMPRALELFELKKSGPGKRGLIRVIGQHPADNQPIEAYSGKFGPYVKHDGINATVPRTMQIDQLSIEQAVALLTERKANPPAPKKTARKSAPRKTAAKKTPARKTAAKKTKKG